MKVIYETKQERKLHNFFIEVKAMLATMTFLMSAMYLMFFLSYTPSTLEIAIPTFLMCVSGAWLMAFVWVNRDM